MSSQTLLPTPKHVPHCHRPSWIPRLIMDTHPGAPVKPISRVPVTAQWAEALCVDPEWVHSSLSCQGIVPSVDSLHGKDKGWDPSSMLRALGLSHIGSGYIHSDDQWRGTTACLTPPHTSHSRFSYSAWVSQGAAKDDISPETLPTHIPKQDAHPKGKPPPGQESPTPAAMTSSRSIDIEHWPPKRGQK